MLHCQHLANNGMSQDKETGRKCIVHFLGHYEISSMASAVVTSTWQILQLSSVQSQTVQVSCQPNLC